MKLSICIPTYNRKEKVLAQFRRLMLQINAIEEGLTEVLVSDNCSSDGSYLALKDEANQRPNVVVYSQQKNLGLVGNLYFLFSKAQGEYIWFLSDDDPLGDRSLSELLKLIFSTKKNFYLLNFSTDLSTDLYWKPVNEYDSLLNDNSWGGMGLLSAQVLKKDCFVNFYESSLSTYNLCQPVAVSLYGLLYLNGMVGFDYAYLQHHVGDYSWKKDSVKVYGIFLLESIQLLKQYNNEDVYIKILSRLKKMNIFCANSLLYIAKVHDIKYLRKLKEEGLLWAVLKNGVMSIIKNLI